MTSNRWPFTAVGWSVTVSAGGGTYIQKKKKARNVAANGRLHAPLPLQMQASITGAEWRSTQRCGVEHWSEATGGGGLHLLSGPQRPRREPGGPKGKLRRSKLRAGVWGGICELPASPRIQTRPSLVVVKSKIQINPGIADAAPPDQRHHCALETNAPPHAPLA